MLKKAICTAALIVLSGCASQPPMVFEPPAPADCCSSWQQVHFEQMTSTKVSGISISVGHSPTFDFPEGRSTFVAYKLPDVKVKSMTVETYVSSGWLPLATVFRPRALFLDPSFREVGNSKLEPMKRAAKYFQGEYYHATTDVPADATYVVIFGASSANTDRLVAYSENGSMYGLPNAYEGKISILFK